ncbi:MAG: hypothetical protein ACYC1Q_10835 [Bacteroidia bacterium]
MRLLFSFIGMLFSIGLLQAQNDSLLSIARSAQTPDTLKAKIYGDLSFEQRLANSDLAYARASLYFAKKSKHTPALCDFNFDRTMTIGFYMAY